jgi:hypothetical protein
MSLNKFYVSGLVKKVQLNCKVPFYFLYFAVIIQNCKIIF